MILSVLKDDIFISEGKRIFTITSLPGPRLREREIEREIERERPFSVRTGCCLRLKVEFIIVFVFL